jgi:hypothetical protein
MECRQVMDFGTTTMPEPPLDPPVADQAPAESDLTDYDLKHFGTYLRLLYAAAEGVDWAEAAQTVLCIDALAEPNRARRAVDMARAKWLTGRG